jgi:hypothetical protein
VLDSHPPESGRIRAFKNFVGATEMNNLLDLLSYFWTRNAAEKLAESRKSVGNVQTGKKRLTA